MVDSFDVAHVVVIAAASTVEGLLPCLVSITMYVSPTPLDLKYRRDSQTFLPPYPSFVKFIPSPIQYLSLQSNYWPPSPLSFPPSLTQPLPLFLHKPISIQYGVNVNKQDILTPSYGFPSFPLSISCSFPVHQEGSIRWVYAQTLQIEYSTVQYWFTPQCLTKRWTILPSLQSNPTTSTPHSLQHMHIINMVHHVMALRKTHKKRYKRLGFHLRRPWLQTLQDKHLKTLPAKFVAARAVYVCFVRAICTDRRWQKLVSGKSEIPSQDG